jgi:hypothetical protein
MSRLLTDNGTDQRVSAVSSMGKPDQRSVNGVSISYSSLFNS